jgi:hypothetical protein
LTKLTKARNEIKLYYKEKEKIAKKVLDSGFDEDWVSFEDFRDIINNYYEVGGDDWDFDKITEKFKDTERLSEILS